MRTAAPLTCAIIVALTAMPMAARAGDATVSSGAVFDERSGEGLYRSICQGCHMQTGEGASGAARYPALAGDPRLATAAYPVSVVLAGRRDMPSFGQTLDDAQVAAVTGYIRTHFGNRFDDPVSAEDVRALRPARRP